MLPVPGAAPPTGYMQSPFVQHVHFPHQGNPHRNYLLVLYTCNGINDPGSHYVRATAYTEWHAS